MLSFSNLAFALQDVFYNIWFRKKICLTAMQPSHFPLLLFDVRVRTKSLGQGVYLDWARIKTTISLKTTLHTQPWYFAWRKRKYFPFATVALVCTVVMQLQQSGSLQEPCNIFKDVDFKNILIWISPIQIFFAVDMENCLCVSTVCFVFISWDVCLNISGPFWGQDATIFS